MIKVVIADDHQIVRQGILQQLEREPDIQVIAEAQDGPTLSAVLAKTPPDVLLLDLMMPGFSALEAVPRFRRQHPEMKILILTGFADETRVQDMVKCGVDGFMVKDERADAYARAIRDVHTGKGYYSPRIFSKALKQKDIELSVREKQVLLLIAVGDSSKAIAQKLSLAEKTVNTYVARIFEKLGTKRRASALARAMKLGLIEVSELECDDWN